LELTVEHYRPRKLVNVHRHVDGPWFWTRYSARPYVGCRSGCEFCFYRAGVYLGRRASATFDTLIQAKDNAVELLDRELARLTPDVIACGDWQQPVEDRLGLSRRMLEVVLARGFPLFVVERSPLLLRDRDLLARIHERSRVAVAISISSVDPRLKRAFEPRSPDVARRLQMITELRAAGIPVGVSLMPILPLVGDDEATLDATIGAAVAHGASFIIGGGLTLAGTQAERTLAAAATIDPQSPLRLRLLYGDDAAGRPRASPPDDYRARIGRLVRQLCRRHGVADRMPRPIVPGPLAINKQLAERLFLRAYDLELEEAAAPRIWAYRKAAWTVDEWPESLHALHAAGSVAALRRLPAVGATIAADLERWLGELCHRQAAL
jgi:DNA repair photolyase